MKPSEHRAPPSPGLGAEGGHLPNGPVGRWNSPDDEVGRTLYRLGTPAQPSLPAYDGTGWHADTPLQAVLCGAQGPRRLGPRS